MTAPRKTPTPTMLKHAESKALFEAGKKNCRTCKATKAIGEFHVNSCKWDGRTDRCKACVNPGFKTPRQRFEKYVDRQAPALPRVAGMGLGACWHWAGSLNTQGYGQLHVKGRPQLTHRVAWRLFRGEIGELGVLHKCDVTTCCNPDHLFLGTPMDNCVDKIRKGRQRGGDLHGSKHPNSKLTAADVVAIRFAHVIAGVGCRRLGFALGVTPTTVTGILKNKAWRRVA